LRITLRLALRNLDRQRTRTASTLVALFVGLFAIGTLLAVGSDVRGELQQGILGSTSFNVFVTAPPEKGPAVDAALRTIPGISQQFSTDGALVQPTEVDGVP